MPPLDPHALDCDRRARIVALSGRTMGTGWNVRLAAPAHIALDAIEAAIAARLGQVVAEMSHWEADSLLARFNRLPAGGWMALPPDFAAVMAAGLDIAARSDGAFDPALGALVDLWGFGPPGAAPPPSAAAIADARAVSGWRKLDFDRGARRLRQPGGLRLDLSGIAKGHAVDAIADLLAGCGLRHCLVGVGGELAGRGVRPDGEPWWVDLENPVGGIAPLRVALHQIAVATSGSYVRGDHNLDAATGSPAAHGVISASVLHASAMQADAWASALTVLGPAAGLALAIRDGLAARIVVRESGGLSEVLSPALTALL